MLLYLVSLGTLVLAPLFYYFVHKLERSYAIIEAVLFFTIAGLVLVNILPEAISFAGWWALLAFAIAWVLPTAGEHLLHQFEERVHMVPIIISVIGLTLHALMDGLVLSYPAGGSLAPHLHLDRMMFNYHPLPLAVALHRFPAAVFMWWVLRPKYGVKFAVTILLLDAVATSVGFWSGAEFIARLHESFSMGIFESVAAGSLMHLASHRIRH